MLLNKHAMEATARRTLRLGWRLLLFWLCDVPGILCGLIPGKFLHGDIASLTSGPVSVHDIAGQLTLYALPAGIFWLISWLFLTLLQKGQERSEEHTSELQSPED